MANKNKVSIVFADLSHTGSTVDANVFPLGIAMIAAYCESKFTDALEISISRYPDEFARLVEVKKPDIACFSNYSWCERLNYSFASRIKERWPDVVTVFGGPNFPVEENEQEAFLRSYPNIDFYIDGEGELPMEALILALMNEGLDLQKVKSAEMLPPSIRCISNGDFRASKLAPRVRDVRILPSPYLNGMMDKFFDGRLTPLVQTSRGCPYSCTFCHDGLPYMTKVARFDQDLINEEMRYIAKRTEVPHLNIADLNFGLFPGDIDTAKTLSDLQDEFGWPTSVFAAGAKNHGERVVEISKILKGAFHAGASVQSTDANVLDVIKRKNISIDQLKFNARSSLDAGSGSYSEIILCLPTDTKQKHISSICDMLDVGIEEMRMFQFILLPGTESASQAQRKLHQYDTRFRVLPRCFGIYEIFGNEFPVQEYHEVCVANKTMSLDDYRLCRKFALMIEIFNNGGLFREVLSLLERHGVKRSQFFLRLFDLVQNDHVLWPIFESFEQDDDANFWQSRQELEAFLKKPDTIQRYLDGEFGANQIFRYRSRALIEANEAVFNLAFSCMHSFFDSPPLRDNLNHNFIEQMEAYLRNQKSQPLEIELTRQQTFHYDFVKMQLDGFQGDIENYFMPEGIEYSFALTTKQRKDLKSYLNQYGWNIDGFGFFLQRVRGLQAFYRQASLV